MWSSIVVAAINDVLAEEISNATTPKEDENETTKKAEVRIFERAEVLNDLPDESVFNDMFSLLRNFLSPYPEMDSQERRGDTNKIKNIKSIDFAKNFTAQKLKDTIKIINVTHANHTMTHPNYVQIWFMMHLPKNEKDQENTTRTPDSFDLRNWINRIFEHLLNNFEKEIDIPETEENDIAEVEKDLNKTNAYLTQTTPSENDTDATNSNADLNELTESTADFHNTFSVDAESTMKTTEKSHETVNVWNIKEGIKKKRKRLAHYDGTMLFLSHNNNNSLEKSSQDTNKDVLQAISDHSPFEMNQIRSKRIKRGVLFFPPEIRNVSDPIAAAKKQKRYVEDEYILRPLKKEIYKSEKLSDDVPDERAQAPIMARSVWLVVTIPTVLCKALLYAL